MNAIIAFGQFFDRQGEQKLGIPVSPKIMFEKAGQKAAKNVKKQYHVNRLASPRGFEPLFTP
jgi:hypothetical protein